MKISISCKCFVSSKGKPQGHKYLGFQVLMKHTIMLILKKAIFRLISNERSPFNFLYFYEVLGVHALQLSVW